MQVNRMRIRSIVAKAQADPLPGAKLFAGGIDGLVKSAALEQLQQGGPSTSVSGILTSRGVIWSAWIICRT